MTLLAALIFAAVVIWLVREIRQFGRRLDALPAKLELIEQQLSERQKVLNKQSKLSVRNAEITRKSTARLADRARALLDETERLHEHVDSTLNDPNLQRTLRRHRT